MSTKKLPNIAARFGARYGSTLRKKWNLITFKKLSKYECPQCLRKSLRYESVGIWKCRKCGFTMSGGAYEPFLLRKDKGIEVKV